MPPPVAIGEHQLRAENLAFDIDVWYPAVAEHTFPTVFLPLTREEAQAMVAYYNKAQRRIVDGSFTTDTVQTLRALEERIDNALQDNPAFADRGAFIRLCGRSPKDGEPTEPKLRAQIVHDYQQALNRLVQEQGQALSGNSRAAAICHTPSWLRVRTGAQAMAIILTSERVFSDMLDWLHYGEPEQIVLRQWSDDFCVATEFRVYIDRGVLVGMSQYDPYAKHAYLQDAKTRAAVVRAVLHAWTAVLPAIETMDGSYCADFGVRLGGAMTTAQLIELSPYRTCTGPALFGWNDAGQIEYTARPDVHDDNITSLLGKDESTVVCRHVSHESCFRIRCAEMDRIADLVEDNWDLQWSASRVDIPRPHCEIYATATARSQQGFWSWTSMFQAWSSWWLASSQPIHLFVYGTLKRHCHWHAKYLTGATFLGQAITVQPQALVIGDCGVPYLLPRSDQDDENVRAKQVHGELWAITAAMMQGLDEYEGIHKGHYTREKVEIIVDEGTRQSAYCYLYALKSDGALDARLAKAEYISAYSVADQRKCYKAIHHIQVKQLYYLGEAATT